MMVAEPFRVSILLPAPTPSSLAALRGASMMGFMTGIEGERAGDKGE
jgi:hypothetical protein